MTDEELNMEDALAVHLLGFGSGREYERKQIIEWFRKNGYQQIAYSIEHREHLK